MKRVSSFIVLAMIAMPSLALSNETANLREWCEDKLQTQDHKQLLEMGQALLEQRLILVGEDIAFAEDCIKSLTGENYRYDAGRMGFIPGPEFESKEAAKLAADQQSANRKDAESQRHADTLALIARVEMERKWAVQRALKQACNRLFSRSPDEAVLNPLCYESFLATGLPD